MNETITNDDTTETLLNDIVNATKGVPSSGTSEKHFNKD